VRIDLENLHHLAVRIKMSVALVPSVWISPRSREFHTTSALVSKSRARDAKRSGLRRGVRSFRVVASDATAPLDSATRAALRMYASEHNKYVVEHARPAQALVSTLEALTAATVAKDAYSIFDQPTVALQLMRFAEFISDDEYVRPLADWTPPPLPEGITAKDDLSFSELRALSASHAQDQFDSLITHLLVLYEDAAPEHLLRAFSPFYGLDGAEHWARAESPFLNPANWEMCRRFSRVLVGVGAGGSALVTCKRELSPSLTKGMVHSFMTHTVEDITVRGSVDPSTSPLAVLRCAQVEALGGSPRLASAACKSILGKTLGDEDEEVFAQKVIEFMSTREEELANVEPSLFLNYLMATYRTSRSEGEEFSLKGRTVNKILKEAGDVQVRMVFFQQL
jgi:hypothetical protein